MPLIYKTNILPKGNLGIWKITEDEHFFLQQLNLFPDELSQLSQIKGKRRIEWLAGRLLIHLLSERVERGMVVKDSYGKPFLEKSLWQVSISHTHQYAAVAASPYPIGVDIQCIVRRIASIAKKFMHPEEFSLLTNTEEDLYIMHVIWGVKESMFKIYSKGALSWTENFRIAPFEFNLAGGELSAKLYAPEKQYVFKAKYWLQNENMVVYVIENL